MRIGDDAERLRVSERTLRYYEQRGLLRPARRESGQREYDEADLLTVRQIRTMLAAGLGTEVIAELLPCVQDVDGIVAPACAELMGVLGVERERISRSIDELLAARATLDAIIGAAPPATDRSAA